MKVRVKLFARARELVGASAIGLELNEPATVGALRRYLAEAYPALEALLPRCAIAVAEEFADDDVRLADRSEVALIPPVSGG